MKYVCPVCGYPELSEEIYTAGRGASFEICPSCGFEFGVSDMDLGITYQQWRRKWIENGMVWWSTHRKAPQNWNPKEQVSKVMHIEGGRW